MLLGTVAAWAAIAIENALLHQQAQYTAVAAERTRLASELHDAVSQLLFSASVVAESLPRLWDDNPEAVWRGLNQLQGLTRGALAEMRTLLLELRPSALLEADLGNVLGQLTQAMAGRGRMHIELHLEGEGQVPEEAQIALYRIAQEALNNVVKHARAQRVDVTLRRLPERVELIITDDGRGFEPDRVLPSSLGLRILRERADAIGADVDIDTDVGRGTRVTVRWPQALESEE